MPSRWVDALADAVSVRFTPREVGGIVLPVNHADI
jgi:hypothetical protein